MTHNLHQVLIERISGLEYFVAFPKFSKLRFEWSKENGEDLLIYFEKHLIGRFIFDQNFKLDLWCYYDFRFHRCEPEETFRRFWNVSGKLPKENEVEALFDMLEDVASLHKTREWIEEFHGTPELPSNDLLFGYLIGKGWVEHEDLKRGFG